MGSAALVTVYMAVGAPFSYRSVFDYDSGASQDPFI